MAKRYGITVVTSSMFDNENVIIGAIVRFNDMYGALVHIKPSDAVFTTEFNDKVLHLVDVFSKNRNIKDVIKVIKVQGTKKSWSFFDKPLMVTNNKITKEALVEYVVRIVFNTVKDVDVIYSTEVISTLPKPKKAKGPSVEVVKPAAASEVIEDVVDTGLSNEDKDMFGIINDIPDAPEGDYDDDDTAINPDELVDQKLVEDEE